MWNRLGNLFIGAAILGTWAVSVVGCSHGGQVKTMAYASMPDHRTYEFEFPIVWKAIENAVRGIKIDDRSPGEVSVQEMRKLAKRSLRTDWIFTQSNDKYREYQVNSFKQKRYLPSRVKYQISAEKVMGGTEVRVGTTEEIDPLKTDGTPDGYVQVEADPARSHDMLEKINAALLSAPAELAPQTD